MLVTKAGSEYNISHVCDPGDLSVRGAGSLAVQPVDHVKLVIGSIKFFADYSFTLYLVHYSIMFAVFLIRPERNFYIFAIMVHAFLDELAGQ